MPRILPPLACLLLAAAAARADETAEAPPGAWLGPLETVSTAGNLGAPRSTAPETRFGTSLHWMRATEANYAGTSYLGDATADGVSWFLEAHLALGHRFEVGLDVEILSHLTYDAPPGAAAADRDDTDFGFLVPRFKVALYTSEALDLSAGLGLLIPTGTAPLWDTLTPVALDPALHLAWRPLAWLSVHASLPFVVDVRVPEGGDAWVDGFFAPAVGVTAMPWSVFGAFGELRMRVWLDAQDRMDLLGETVPGEPFQLLQFAVGVRSRPWEWLLLEAAALVPAAGSEGERAVAGLAFRAAFTPSIF